MTSPQRSLTALPYTRLGQIGEHLLVCQDRALSTRTILERHRVLVHAEAVVRVSLVAADEAAVRRWWRGLTRRGLSATTRACYLSHVRAFYRWAVREELRPDDPTARIDSPKRPQRGPRGIDPVTAATVIGQIPGQPGLACRLALFAGARRAEIAVLRGSDVLRRVDGPVLRLRGKGNVERTVPITDALAAEIQRLSKLSPRGERRRRDWVFGSRKRPGEPMTADHVGHIAATALRDAGLPTTLHPLRHTVAQRMLEATGDIAQVQVLLGHAHLGATQVYARHRGVPRAALLDLFTDSSSSGGPDVPAHH